MERFIAKLAENGGAEEVEPRLLDELQRALHESERRLAAIVDTLAEAVTIRGADDHLIYANRAALQRLGFASVEELAAADPRALMGPYQTTGEHGQPIALDDLPSVRVLRGEEPEPLLLRAVHRVTGEEQWSLLKAAAVRDSAGAIEAAVTIIEDMTAVKRSALRMEFLARAGKLLASSLDYAQTLRNVAGLAVPQIADWCAVDLFDEAGTRVPVAVAHVDPDKVQMAERLRAYEPERLDPERGLGLVRRTGESLLYPQVPAALLERAAVDAEHLRLLRAVGIRSALIVPLRAEGRVLGALTLVNAESGRTFDETDLDFAEQIAERAALAVANARLYTERSEIALTLQRSLLPDELPAIPGWEVAALYRPAGHGTEVGGDFYDLWPSEEGWLMMIGDVTGKGVAAAAVTSLVRHTAWAASESDTAPAAILARVDRALRRGPALSICTALCLHVRGARATLALGGHPPPLRVDADGVRELGRHGTLLGAFPQARRPEVEFELHPGATLVAFTDGVTDAVGREGERFGAARLHAVLDAGRGERPAALRRRLLVALEQFQVGPQADDTAVVLMRYTGESAHSHPEGPGGRIAEPPGTGSPHEQTVAV
jgi:PAS domain S-box-containing protein